MLWLSLAGTLGMDTDPVTIVSAAMEPCADFVGSSTVGDKIICCAASDDSVEGVSAFKFTFSGSSLTFVGSKSVISAVEVSTSNCPTPKKEGGRPRLSAKNSICSASFSEGIVGLFFLLTFESDLWIFMPMALARPSTSTPSSR